MSFAYRRKNRKGDPNLIFQAVAGYADTLYRDNVSATNFASTFQGENRTYIGSDGLLHTAAKETVIIDYVNGVPMLRLEPAGTNLLFGSNTFTAAAGWTLFSITGPATPDAIGPDGTLSAWTITDASADYGYLAKWISKAISDSATYFQATVAFQKTTTAVTFPAFGLMFWNGPAPSEYAMYSINTNTGVATASTDFSSAANMSVVVKSEGNFWRVYVSATDNGANDYAALRIYPAVNADASATWAAATQGSCVIANAKLTTGSIPSSYFAGAAAQGGVQATGTLTIGKPYHIITTEVDHFGTGVIADQYIIAAAATALDANNTVREHGTVRLSEANTVTLAMPAAVTAAIETNGIGTVVVKGRFAFARAAGVVTNVVSSEAATASLIYTTTTAGNISANDGTAVAEVAGAYTANTDWKIALKFPSDTNKYRIGIDVAGAGIAWGTEAAFDGAINATANLILGYVLHGPTWIKWIKMYDSILTDAQIDAMS